MYLKFFMHKKRISIFSVEFCLSADKIRRETLLCFKKILVSKFFMHRRGHHGFVEKFLSHWTETENLVREAFCVSENFWYGRKFMGNRRGDRNFLSKVFYLTVPKNFVWKISVKETSFMGRRGWGGG